MFVNFLQLPVDKMGTKEPWSWRAVCHKKVGWYVMSREDVTGGYMTPHGWFVCYFEGAKE